jgi:hypothetical protein
MSKVKFDACEIHNVTMSGFLKPFCHLCREEKKEKSLGKDIIKTHCRTFLRKYNQHSIVHLSGKIMTKMEYTPTGTSQRIMLLDIVFANEKVRLTILDDSMKNAARGANYVAVTGMVRHDVEQLGETIDDVFVTNIKDISTAKVHNG